MTKWRSFSLFPLMHLLGLDHTDVPHTTALMISGKLNLRCVTQSNEKWMDWAVVVCVDVRDRRSGLCCFITVIRSEILETLVVFNQIVERLSFSIAPSRCFRSNPGAVHACVCRMNCTVFMFIVCIQRKKSNPRSVLLDFTYIYDFTLNVNKSMTRFTWKAVIWLLILLWVR